MSDIPPRKFYKDPKSGDITTYFKIYAGIISSNFLPCSINWLSRQVHTYAPSYIQPAIRHMFHNFRATETSIGHSEQPKIRRSTSETAECSVGYIQLTAGCRAFLWREMTVTLKNSNSYSSVLQWLWLIPLFWEPPVQSCPVQSARHRLTSAWDGSYLINRSHAERFKIQSL